MTERRACEIRLRAERKAGKLLAKMEKAQGKRTDLVVLDDQVDGRGRRCVAISGRGDPGVPP